jgi:hypothetical protein
MPFDTVVAVAIVTAGFILFAGVLAWITWYTRETRGPRS